jgi:uncharacterized protein involved in exopolysaccharide biosynthesis
MSSPDHLPEDPNPMPVRTPGLADALRRLAGNPLPNAWSVRSVRPTYASFVGIEARARAFYAVVKRQTQLFAAVFIGVAVVLGFLLAIQTPQFESIALLLVKVGRELVYTPQVGEQPAMSSRDKQTVINSELAIMRSEPVIASAVTQVGMEKLYPDLGERLTEAASDPEAERVAAALHSKAAQRLRESLVVLALPDADVMQVSFRHPDAAIAQSAVSSLIDKFTEAHLGAFSEPEVVRFLEERVNTYRDSLDAAEGELRELEVAHPLLADEMPEVALAKRLEEVRAQIDAIDAQINQVRLTAVGENSALGQAQRERLTLEMEASKVKGHLRATADRRISVVKKFIAARRGEIDAQIGLLQRKRDELQTQLAQYDGERVHLPTLSSQHHQLRRERDAHEEQYNTYQKRLRDARFSHEMDTEKIASISVIQKATLAPEAIWPLPPVLGTVVVLALSFIVAGLSATIADHYGWTWPTTWNANQFRDGFHRLAEQARRR